MINPDALNRMIGAKAVDLDGRELGIITEVHLDDATGQPAWAVVQRDSFGTGATCVPLSGAELMGDRLRVPHEKSVVASAPRLPADQGHLSREDEAELRGHYGVAPIPERKGDADGSPQLTGEPPSAVMTRSEEQLRVGTEWAQTERVRVRKVIVTEDVTVTVTVSREELRVERESLPTGEAAAPADGAAPQAFERVIVLHAERPVVSTEVVPLERVRIATVTVTGSVDVTDSVRVEHIDAVTHPASESRPTNR